MHLALDIGNSTLKGGLFCEGKLTQTFRISYGVRKHDINKHLRSHLTGVDVQRVSFCSVVPVMTEQVASIFDTLPLFEVTPDINLPFRLAYESPETLGTDRLAAAIGGWLHYAVPQSAESCIVVDAGTAITIDVISRTAGFQGGIIAPGPGLMTQSLHDGAEQLPLVSHMSRPHLIGATTREAIESGVVHGTAAMVRGLLGQIEDEIEGPSSVVLTGGWSQRLSSELGRRHETDAHLVLRGLDEARKLNPLNPALAPAPDR